MLQAVNDMRKRDTDKELQNRKHKRRKKVTFIFKELKYYEEKLFLKKVKKLCYCG